MLSILRSGMELELSVMALSSRLRLVGGEIRLVEGRRLGMGSTIRQV